MTCTASEPFNICIVLTFWPYAGALSFLVCFHRIVSVLATPFKLYPTFPVQTSPLQTHFSARKSAVLACTYYTRHAIHSRYPAAGPFGKGETAVPQTVAIEHAVNMLMARVAFDLLRSPRFKQYVMAYVQKKLDDLKAPDYINALQVKF